MLEIRKEAKSLIEVIKKNVENLFKRINRFGSEYNYCFGTFIPPTLSSIALSLMGAVGGIIEATRQKSNLTGYFVNKNEREICLIPVILDDNRIMQIDIDEFIDIRPEDIKSIKIKNEDFIYKVITITLNDKTKYVMKTAKKIKGADYHKDNLKKFIEIYNK